MQFHKVYIPYGGYWSTPFVKWQGNFASLHPGYYVVFTGIYASRDDAEAALPAASRRFPNAAVRSVVR